MLKRGKGDLAFFETVDGVAVKLLVLLFLDAQVEDALHGGGIVAGGGDALAGAELRECLVLLGAQRLKAAEEGIGEGVEGDSHGLIRG